MLKRTAGGFAAPIYVAVGAGQSTLTLPGSIYLARPLQAADPASLSVTVPAHVGPYDFGSVVTRARVVLRPFHDPDGARVRS